MAKKSFLNKNWNYIIFFVVLCLAAGAIYYFFWHKKTIEFFTDDIHITVIGNFVQKPIVNAQQLVIMMNKALVELDRLNKNNEVDADKVKKVAEAVVLKVLSADNIKTIESNNNSTIYNILEDSATQLYNNVKRDHPNIKYSTLSGAKIVNLLNNDKIKSYVTGIRGINSVMIERFEAENQGGEIIGADAAAWGQSKMGKCFARYLLGGQQIEPWWNYDYSIVSVDSIVEGVVNAIQMLPDTTKASFKKKHLKNMLKELIIIYMGTETPCTGLEDSIELIGQQIMALREIHMTKECTDMESFGFYMPLSDINDEKLMLLAKDALKMRQRYCWKFGEKNIGKVINIIYAANKDDTFTKYNKDWIALDEDGNTNEWILWGHMYNTINDLMGQIPLYVFIYNDDIEGTISKYAQKFETGNLGHLFKDSMVDTYETHPIKNFGATINNEMNYKLLYNFRNRSDNSDFFNVMREAFYKIFGSIVFKGIIMSRYIKNISQHGLRNNAQIMWHARDNKPINIINNIVILSNIIATKIEDGTLESSDHMDTGYAILKSYILYEFGLLETFEVPEDGYSYDSADLNITSYMYYWSITKEKATEVLHEAASDMIFETEPDIVTTQNNAAEQTVVSFTNYALFTESDFQDELNALTNLNINHDTELNEFNAKMDTFINRGDIVIDVNLDKSYKCENGICVEAADGEYDTIAECEAACNGNNPLTYNYVNDDCVEVTGSNGTYNTIEQCRTAHPGVPAPKYKYQNNACIENSNGIYNSMNDCQTAHPGVPVTLKYKYENGSCLENSNGTYNSINDCNAAHTSNTSKYSCVNGLCAINSNGIYNTIEDCNTNCVNTNPNMYKCDNGNCIVHQDGTYTSLDNCQASCTIPNPERDMYKCDINGNCIVAPDGNYTSLEECQSNCASEPIITESKYACSTNGCVGNNNGPYNDFNNCKNNCSVITQSANKFRCNDGTCVANDNGSYNTLNNCEDNCTQDPTIMEIIENTEYKKYRIIITTNSGEIVTGYVQENGIMKDHEGNVHGTISNDGTTIQDNTGNLIGTVAQDIIFQNPFNIDNINNLPIGKPSTGKNNINSFDNLRKIYLGPSVHIKNMMIIAYAYIFRDESEYIPSFINSYIYDKNGNFMGEIYLGLKRNTYMGELISIDDFDHYKYWTIVFSVDWDDSDMFYADKYQNIQQDQNGYLLNPGTKNNSGQQPVVNQQGQPVVNQQGQPVVNQQGQPIINQQGQPVVNQQGQPVVNQQGQPVVNQQGQPIINQQGQSQTITESVSPALSDYDVYDFGRVSMNNHYYANNGTMRRRNNVGNRANSAGTTDTFSYGGRNDAYAEIYQEGTKGVSNIYSPRIYIEE